MMPANDSNVSTIENGLRNAVVVSVSDNGIALDNGELAIQAASCLLQAEAGDQVLCASTGGQVFVLAVLVRQAKNARMSVVGADKVRWVQPKISLTATDNLEMTSMGDAELNAPVGSVTVTAQNWFASVNNSMVENAKQKVGQFGDWVVGVKGLFRSHSEHSLISSEQEYRVDAKRINFG